jgi:pyruvate carboxylase subunit B
MPGMIVSYDKNVGDAVNEGRNRADPGSHEDGERPGGPGSGTVQAINYKSGDSVAKGDVLCVIG